MIIPTALILTSLRSLGLSHAVLQGDREQGFICSFASSLVHLTSLHLGHVNRTQQGWAAVLNMPQLGRCEPWLCATSPSLWAVAKAPL